MLSQDYEENCRDDDTIKRKLDIMFAEVRNDNAELFVANLTSPLFSYPSSLDL